MEVLIGVICGQKKVTNFQSFFFKYCKNIRMVDAVLNVEL